jgi:hypothetical protein
MANQWFKFYGAEYLSDPKMDRLTVQERSCWITLLCMASQTNGIIKYISVEGLLNKSGIHFNPYDSTEWDSAQNALRTFEQYEMIKININGHIEITNWEKRQEHNLSVAERVARSRAKKKDVTNDVTNVTSEENRIEENRIEENRIEEDRYGEFENVKLKIDEYNKMIERFGEKNTKVLIEQLSSYLKSTNKRYASHYATMLNWARRKVEEHKAKTQPKQRTLAILKPE